MVTVTYPNDQGPANKGQACVRGRFCVAPLVNHANRLRYPLVKKGGELTPVEWEEAIPFICENLKGFSGEQIGVVASSFLTNEAAYLMQKFAREVLRTPNIDNTSMLSGAVAASLYPAIGAGAGTGSIQDIETSETILIVGTDLCKSHPVLNVNIVKAKKSGAKSILIDSKTGGHSQMVDQHLHSDDLIGTFTSVFKRLAEKDNRSDISNEVIDSIGEAPETEISRHLASFFQGQKVSILFGEGIKDCGDPQKLITLLYNISLISGNSEGLIPLWTEGNAQGVCDMGALPGFLPGWHPSEKAGLNFSEMTEGNIKALYTTEGFSETPKGVEFIILQDIFPSELMASADVVLPTTAFTETEGTITSFERRVLPIRACTRPPGMALPDWEIICQIATMLGGKGFDFSSPEEITAEIAGSTFVKGAGIWPIPKKELSLAPIQSGTNAIRNDGKARYRSTLLENVVEDLNILYNARGV